MWAELRAVGVAKMRDVGVASERGVVGETEWPIGKQEGGARVAICGTWEWFV